MNTSIFSLTIHRVSLKDILSSGRERSKIPVEVIIAVADPSGPD
jgi:hypothetical protein